MGGLYGGVSVPRPPHTPVLREVGRALGVPIRTAPAGPATPSFPHLNAVKRQ